MIATHDGPRWPSYGLRSDPFFSQALTPEEAGDHPITLFRGREDAIGTLCQRIMDGASSATTLIAEGGYGKSSLASRVCHDLRSDYLILPNELAFDQDDPATDFFYSTLDGAIQALLLRGTDLPPPPRDPTRDHLATYPGLVQALRLTALYRDSHGLQLGAHIGPFHVQTGGGALMQPRFHSKNARAVLKALWVDVKKLTNCQGIVVRLNNMDEPFLTGQANTVNEFLQQVRDILQQPGYHYLICGNRDLPPVIDRHLRVSSVFTPHHILTDFTVEDVQTIIAARYEHLRLPDRDVTPPAEPGLVAELHAIHRGDLRNILKDLRTAMGLASPVPGEPVLLAGAKALLEDHHYAGLADLSQVQWDLVEALVEKPLRSTDLAATLKRTAARISQVVKDLRPLGVIEECEGPEPGQYLRLPGRTLLAIAGKQRQT